MMNGYIGEQTKLTPHSSGVKSGDRAVQAPTWILMKMKIEPQNIEQGITNIEGKNFTIRHSLLDIRYSFFTRPFFGGLNSLEPSTP